MSAPLTAAEREAIRGLASLMKRVGAPHNVTPSVAEMLQAGAALDRLDATLTEAERERDEARSAHRECAAEVALRGRLIGEHAAARDEAIMAQGAAEAERDALRGAVEEARAALTRTPGADGMLLRLAEEHPDDERMLLSVIEGHTHALAALTREAPGPGLREQIEKLPAVQGWDGSWIVNRAAVLAILDAKGGSPCR